MRSFVIRHNVLPKLANMKAQLFFFFLIFPFFVFAQDNKSGFGTIGGTILTADGQGTPYVSVWIKNTGKGTITDDKGNFEIKKIKPGTYILGILYQDTLIVQLLLK